MPPLSESALVSRRVQLDPQRHKFHNKAAFILTGLTVLLLVTLAAFFGTNEDSERTLNVEQNNNSNNVERGLSRTNYSDFSCRKIYTVIPDAGFDQCQFARTCNDGEGVWAPFVFCQYSHFTTRTLFMAISPIMIVWMITLFRLLGSTAEDFFSPSLEMFSRKLGLPPRFAGVTLLALGNGAADVSATMSAFAADVNNGYKFSLGALTGAAMLVGCLVSGVVVLVAEGVPCRGALIRDVTALFITICVVWHNLSSGRVGPESVTLYLTLYGAFVAIVLVADVYHRTVVLPRLRAMQAQQDQPAVDESGIAVSQAAIPNPSIWSRAITAFSNYDNLCQGDTTTGENGGVAENEVADVPPVPNTWEDQDVPIPLHGQNGILHGNGDAVPSLSPTEIDGGGTYSLIQDNIDQLCVDPANGGFGAANWRGAFHDNKKEVLSCLSQTLEDIIFNGDLNMAEKGMLLCEFPFTIMRKITVPIPCDGYYNRGIIALAMAISPLWIAYYAWVGYDINFLAGGAALFSLLFWTIALVGAAMIMRYAPGGDGAMSLCVATPIALYGFVIAATWIDFIADHLVSLLDFMGIVMHIPGSIMGLTVLAWGNSMGDLSANMTMARKGLANMAMTACFAGPVFNILVGLGLGFSSLAAKTGNPVAAVSLSYPVVTGFTFVLLNCAAILLTGAFIGKGRIESYYGYIALGLYTLYLIVSIFLEFYHGLTR